MLSGLLAGALAGTINITGLFETSVEDWRFLLLCGILALLSSVIFLAVFILSDRFNVRDLYGNGSVIPLVSALAGLGFLFVGKHLLDNNLIRLVNGDGLFYNTDVWHFLVIPVAATSTYLSTKVNSQYKIIYDQQGLVKVTMLLLLGGLLLPLWPFHGLELSLVWLAGIFIGLTRLSEYQSATQFLSASVLFGLFYILLRNLLVDLPMFVGIISFLTVWLVRVVMPSGGTANQPKLDQSNPRTNLSSIDNYYQNQSKTF
jgi:hypothetical protein